MAFLMVQTSHNLLTDTHEPVGGEDAVHVSIYPVSWKGEQGIVRGMFFSAEERPSLGVVACNALWEEGECSRRFLSDLGRYLARRGIALLRFDYGGLGESDGEDSCATLYSCLADIREAMAAMAQLIGDVPLVLLGIRLGANLLSYLESQVAGIVCMEPVTNLATHWREMEVGTLASSPGATLSEIAVESPAGTMCRERYGFRIPVTFFEQLSEAEKGRCRPRAEAAISVFGLSKRTNSKVLQKWARERFDASDSVVASHHPVQKFWLSRHRETKMSSLYESLFENVEHAIRPLGKSSICSSRLEPFTVSDDLEVPCFLPSAIGRTYFVRHSAQVMPSQKDGICIILVGPVPHDRCGPQRMYVRMARCFAAEMGLPTFRFDPVGCGESDGDITLGTFANRRYQLECCIEHLRAEGFDHFLMIGICSGAWHALRMVSDRNDVVGFAMLNPPVLNWHSRMSATINLVRRAFYVLRQGAGPMALFRIFGFVPLRYRLGLQGKRSNATINMSQEKDYALMENAPFPMLIVYGSHSNYLADFHEALRKGSIGVLTRKASTQLTVVPGGNDTFASCQSRSQLFKVLFSWLSASVDGKIAV